MIVYESNNHLEHHGILGQKWGVRRYQNKDGSYKNEGKKHRDKEYASTRTKSLESKYAKGSKNVSKSEIDFNKKVDKKVNDYIDKTSTGKAFVSTIIMGGGQRYKTYVTARALGEGRVKSWVRSWLDINGSAIAADVAGGTVAGGIGKLTDNTRTASTAGSLTDYAIQEKIGDYSLQQRALRKKYYKKSQS